MLGPQAPGLGVGGFPPVRTPECLGISPSVRGSPWGRRALGSPDSSPCSTETRGKWQREASASPSGSREDTGQALAAWAVGGRRAGLGEGRGSGGAHGARAGSTQALVKIRRPKLGRALSDSHKGDPAVGWAPSHLLRESPRLQEPG